jgi:DNA-binding CsgD family transcriptional regulator
MPAKIPKSIREQVIKQWLQGMSRDEIAKVNDIGAGTVSDIIKDIKQTLNKKRFLILTYLGKWLWS